VVRCWLLGYLQGVRKRTPLFIVVFLFVCLFSQGEESLFETYQTNYVSRAAGIGADYTTNAKKLLIAYMTRLTALETKAQSDGDLELLLRVRKELEQINQTQVEGLKTIVIRGTDDLSTLKNSVRKALVKIAGKRAEAEKKLFTEHKTRLEALQKSLTKNDQIDEAIHVQKAIASMQAEFRPPPVMSDPSATAHGTHRTYRTHPASEPGFTAGEPVGGMASTDQSRAAMPAATTDPYAGKKTADGLWSVKYPPPNRVGKRTYTTMEHVPKFSQVQPLQFYPLVGQTLHHAKLDVRIWAMRHEITSSGTNPRTAAPLPPRTYYWPRLLIKAKGQLAENDLKITLYRVRGSSRSTNRDYLNNCPSTLLVDMPARSTPSDYIHVQIADKTGRPLFEAATAMNVTPLQKRVAAIRPSSTVGQSTFQQLPSQVVRPSSIYTPGKTTIGRKSPTAPARSTFNNRTPSRFSR